MMSKTNSKSGVTHRVSLDDCTLQIKGRHVDHRKPFGVSTSNITVIGDIPSSRSSGIRIRFKTLRTRVSNWIYHRAPNRIMKHLRRSRKPRPTVEEDNEEKDLAGLFYTIPKLDDPYIDFSGRSMHSHMISDAPLPRDCEGLPRMFFTPDGRWIDLLCTRKRRSFYPMLKDYDKRQLSRRSSAHIRFDTQPTVIEYNPEAKELSPCRKSSNVPECNGSNTGLMMSRLDGLKKATSNSCEHYAKKRKRTP